MKKESLRTDGRGIWTGAVNWTGESQAIAFTDTAGSTEITLTNKHDLVFFATEDCTITIGATTGIDNAHATQKNRCFPIGKGMYFPIYVPPNYMMRTAGVHEDDWTLFVNVVAISTSGTLYAFPMFGQGEADYGGNTTTSSSTTTTTTTTSTTTTTTTSTTT